MLRPARLACCFLPLALAACGFSSNDSAMSFSGAPGQNAGAAPPRDPSQAGETYAEVHENDFVETAKQPTSTFAIDVDTGSYSLMRRDVTAQRLPVAEGVRPEEYLNYFKYDYPAPTDGKPFSVNVDAAPSFFGPDLHLVRVGLQGRIVPPEQRQRANLVFLVDVSGSMQASNKLPLVQYTLKQLVRRLEPTDTLGIVTYAGYEKVLLDSTAVSNKGAIYDAIDGLVASGSTNGEGGIRKAYELAEKGVQQNGVNRVVLCTDGDFNVGLTGDALISLIEKERDKGITISTLGYGDGNYNDRDMERLADHGNGNYAFVDNYGEANRVVGEKLVSTLEVIAKDVKIQVEFKPDAVSRYRLVGYENRVMANEDFRNDAKDAGELGAGHSVTAFYEVELTPAAKAGGLNDGVAAAVRLRYKEPNATAETAATEFETPFTVGKIAPSFDAASPDFRFAAATAEYAEILRRSKHSTGARFDDVISIASATANGQGDRLEMIELVKSAKTMWK